MSDSKDLTAAEILALERGERTFKESLKVGIKPCPFCGCAVSRCDESPLYGGSIMHDETECLLKNNLLFHGNIAERWNSRPLEDALQARIAELEAEVTNLNDWLTAWKESLNLAQAEIAKLIAIAIQWHKYPDEKPPIDGRYLFWDSDGNAPHVLPYNDIVVRDNPGVFSTQTHWAYLPVPPEEGE